MSVPRKKDCGIFKHRVTAKVEISEGLKASWRKENASAYFQPTMKGV